MTAGDETQTFRFQRPLDQAFVRLDGGDCRTISEVVCRIRNFKHVAKLGESFRRHIEAGDNRIIFASTGYQDSQKKAVFALGCYLADVMRDQNVLLLTAGKDGDAFKFFEASQEVTLKTNELKSLDKTKLYSFGENFSIMDLQEILSGSSDRDEILASLLSLIDAHDVVLWNSPPVQVMRQNLHFYHRLLQVFRMMTLVVGRNTMTTSDVQDVKDFFESHGISLRGAVFSSMAAPEEMK